LFVLIDSYSSSVLPTFSHFYIRSVLNLDAQNTDALYLRSLALFLLDSHPLSTVISFLSNGLAYDPDNRKLRDLFKSIKRVDAAKEEGNTAFRKGEYKAAIDIYTKILEEDLVGGNNENGGGVLRVKLLSNRATAQSKVNSFNKCDFSFFFFFLIKRLGKY